MRLIIFLLISVSPLVGCNQQPYFTQSRQDNGLVVFLTGIEGRTPVNNYFCKTLADSGVDHAIKIEDWTSRWGPLVSLHIEERNRKVAAEIASDIRNYQVNYPGKPVVVIGQSGGGGIATWVVELMEKDDPVDGLILLVPALSPDYDLTAALDRSDKGIVSIHSKMDFIILGLGTKVFGSMDRKHTKSAGMVGFELPSAESDATAAYSKLFQIKWDTKMIRTGYIGGHFTISSPKYVREFIVPMILADDWNQLFMDKLAESEAVAPDSTENSDPKLVVDPATEPESVIEAVPEPVPVIEPLQKVPQRQVIPPDAIIEPL